MSSSSSQGIQTLLEAEKEASKIVEKARQYRTQRLKEARLEASKEIDALKQKKNQDFQEFEKQHLGSTDDVVKSISEETKVKISEIKELYNKNKDSVAQKLIETVLNVKPEPHRNSKFESTA
ncbi:V-type ATPase [Neoconidiobolus thromboides FSU 785]|nr:V-type ATPase [Neoconidiobolus thromboides FSU 785]